MIDHHKETKKPTQKTKYVDICDTQVPDNMMKKQAYIGSCCRDAEAEENPLKGKPGTEPEKKFN